MDWNIIKEKCRNTIKDALRKYMDKQYDEAAFLAVERQW